MDGSRIAGGSLFGPRVGAATAAPHVTLTPTKTAQAPNVYVTSAMCFSVHVFALNLTVMYAVYPTIGAADGGQIVFALREVEQSLRALGISVIGHISDAGRVQIRAETKLRAAISGLGTGATAAIDADDSSSDSESSDDDAVAEDEESDPDGVSRRIDFGAGAQADDNGEDAEADDDAAGDDDVRVPVRDTPLSYSWSSEEHFDCLLEPSTVKAAEAALERVAAPHSFDFPHMIKLFFKHLHRSTGWKMRMAAGAPVVSVAPFKALVRIVRATSIQLGRPDFTTRRLVLAATPPRSSYDTMKVKPALAMFGSRQFASDVAAVWGAAQQVPYIVEALRREAVTLESLEPLVELSKRFAWLSEHVYMSKLAIGPRQYWTVLRPRMLAEAEAIESELSSWPPSVPDELAPFNPPKQTLRLFAKMLRGHVEIFDKYYAHAAKLRAAAGVLQLPEQKFIALARPARAATQQLEDQFRIVRERSRDPDAEDVDAALSASNHKEQRELETQRRVQRRNAARDQRQQTAATLENVARLHE